MPRDNTPTSDQAIVREYAPALEALLRTVGAVKFTVIKDLVGGRSGALVLLVDVAPERGRSGPSGQYVLKLQRSNRWNTGADAESQRHEAAIEYGKDWAQAHVPGLVAFAEKEGCIALLYESAGEDPWRLQTADAVDWQALRATCKRVAMDLLHRFNVDYTRASDADANSTLRKWLGYRVEPVQAPRLAARLDRFTADGLGLVVGRRALPDPRFLIDRASSSAASRIRFDGMLHGDLHLGNVLLDGSGNGSNPNYWLIDFAMAGPGPLFYDHAYLECSFIARYLETASADRLLGFLEAATAQKLDGLSMTDVGLATCFVDIHQALEQWQVEKEPKRAAPFKSQLWLARVAAGLNWAAKPVNEHAAHLGTIYAAYATEQYLMLFQRDAIGDALRVAPKRSGTGHVASPEADEEIRQERATAELSSHFRGFEDGGARYVLVAGAQDLPEEGPGGTAPWSVVVDLDPASDNDGLLSRSEDLLSRTRSLHVFGTQVPRMSFDRGTAWMMAAGWPSHFESPPVGIKEWRWVYPEIVRELATQLKRASSLRPVHCIVMPGPVQHRGMLTRVLESFEETFRGDVEFFFLDGEYSDPEIKSIGVTLEASVEEFFAYTQGCFGTSVADHLPSLPGNDGPVLLDLPVLRNLEEDMEVLHSDVLFEAARGPRASDEFWRGSPPTWIDLQAGLDVARDLAPQLTEVLRRQLGRRRNNTVELRHDPGAGGTTLARRAAWDLHRQYPTAILRRISETTLDRIDRLYHLVNRAVLLVVDAAVISIAAREQLYRGLAARNASVVMLHVLRHGDRTPGKDLYLADPMSPEESKRFARVFASQTTDRMRRMELRRVANGELTVPYQSPFFFGLFTYEREFRKVDAYVEGHLETASDEVRNVLSYLALVTRFSQIGVDEGLLASWLGLDPRENALEDLTTVLGAMPGRLVVRSGRSHRLLHPIIAEDVLRQTLGGDSWQGGLHDVALRFIAGVAHVLGPDSDEALQLFDHLFIQRSTDAEGSRSANFAPLINDMPFAAGALKVLTRLTEVCPDVPHFWNHRGRYLAYIMKTDFAAAEANLEMAVELTAGQDSVNYHTLGQVRRLWIEQEVSSSFTNGRPDPKALLAGIGEIFDRASAAFARAREINPDSDHAYVTPIQLTLYIADYLRRAAGARDIAELTEGDSRVSAWIRANMFEAEELYSRLEEIRERPSSSRFVLDVRQKLSAAWGDLDALIQSWESGIILGSETPDLRRALSAAYLSRQERNWATMPNKELRRIADMMDANLRAQPANDRDLRMWLDASRRLPEFSLIAALERVGAWAARSSTREAHFYAYVLHFAMRRSGLEADRERMDFHMQRARELAAGRANRQRGLEWLANDPDWFPFANHRDLGVWDVGTGFWRSTDRLQRAVGVIHTIDSPQAGRIRLEDGSYAFFAPGQQFRESQHIGALVTFYLGFSYEGLRAWRHELVGAPNGDAVAGLPATHTVPAGRDEGEERRSKPPIVEPACAVASTSLRREVSATTPPEMAPKDSLNPDLVEAVAAAVREYIRSQDVSNGVRPKQLTPVLLSRFPGRPVHARLGFASGRELLMNLPGIRIDTEGLVRLS